MWNKMYYVNTMWTMQCEVMNIHVQTKTIIYGSKAQLSTETYKGTSSKGSTLNKLTYNFVL